MFWCLIFLFYGASSLSSAHILLSPQSARIVEGNSIRFILKSSKTLSIKECTLNIANKTIYVNESTFEENLIFHLHNNDSDMIQWLNLEYCEFLISNATKFSNGRFSIAFSDKLGEKEIISTTLSVIAPPINESIITSALGALATINCISKSGINPSFCRIYSPHGNIVANKCSYDINPVKPTDVGKWLCLMGIRGSIEGLTHSVTLNLKEKEIAVGYFSNFSESVEFKCILLNSNLGIRWCRAIRPDGTFLMLTEGNIFQRYSSLETSFESKICNLEIKRPLDPNSDIGKWRIDIGFGDDDFTGCYFTLSSDKKKSLESNVIVMEEEKTEKVMLGDILKFDCSVPWPIKYCYVRDPNGHLVQPLTPTMQRLQQLGICQIEIKNVTMEQNGKWICGVSSQNFEEDKLSFTYVTVVKGELFTEQYRTKTKNGIIDYLICRSPKANPLSYCRFVSPSGKGYNLNPISDTDLRISYFGTGLEKGECGMQINNILNEDIGNWTCGTFYESSFSNEKRATFKLERSEPSVAFSVSMGVIGLMILGAIVVFASFKCRKREQRFSFRNDVRTPSISSEENLTPNQDQSVYTVEYNSQQRNVTIFQATTNNE